MEQQRRFLRKYLRWLAAIALLLVLVNPHWNVWPRAYADASFTVNSTEDSVSSGSPDGLCDNGAGLCTLREAIKEANAASGNKTIAFSLSGAVIQLTLGTLTLTGDDITLDGGSMGNVTLNGANQPDGQGILEIRGNRNTVRNLTVRESKLAGIRVGDFTNSGKGNDNLVENVAVMGGDDAGIYVHGSATGGNGNTITACAIGAPNWVANVCLSWASNGTDGVYVDGGADDTVILSNRIVCNGGNGIYLDGVLGGNSGTRIEGNQIGNDNFGRMANFLAGIYDRQNTETTILANIVSGNLRAGIKIDASSSVVIYANAVGVSASAAQTIPNGEEGLLLMNGAHHTAIGSASNAAYRNIFSGNSGYGVSLTSGAHDNVLDGNYIGLGAAGAGAIPNGLGGVFLYDAPTNTLSSSAATVEQYIAGNVGRGVYALDTHHVTINAATFVGVAADHSPAGNTLGGILLANTSNSVVRPGLVAHNGAAGIAITGNSSSGNQLCPLEVDANAGLPIDLGNDGHTPNDFGDGDSGPNALLNYPWITTANGNAVAGTVCAACQVYIYHASGNPAANGGGGTYLMTVSASPSGAWNATLPAGESAETITLVAYDPGTGNSSEMSTLYGGGGQNYVFLPIVRR